MRVGIHNPGLGQVHLVAHCKHMLSYCRGQHIPLPQCSTMLPKVLFQGAEFEAVIWTPPHCKLVLTPAQLQVLSRGLNFAPSPQFIHKAHIVAIVKAAITRSGTCKEQATKARVGVIGALSHAKPPPKNTLPEERKTVKQLATDKNIVVLPADKGRATVVMDQKDYHTKIKALLDDRNTYKPVAKDPTSILLDLRQKGRLSEEAYHHLHSSAGSVPRLYGLPKVHKPNTPLRPIVSFISSPNIQAV